MITTNVVKNSNKSDSVGVKTGKKKVSKSAVTVSEGTDVSVPEEIDDRILGEGASETEYMNLTVTEDAYL